MPDVLLFGNSPIDESSPFRGWIQQLAPSRPADSQNDPFQHYASAEAYDSVGQGQWCRSQIIYVFDKELHSLFGLEPWMVAVICLDAILALTGLYHRCSTRGFVHFDISTGNIGSRLSPEEFEGQRDLCLAELDRFIPWLDAIQNDGPHCSQEVFAGVNDRDCRALIIDRENSELQTSCWSSPQPEWDDPELMANPKDKVRSATQASWLQQDGRTFGMSSRDAATDRLHSHMEDIEGLWSVFVAVVSWRLMPDANRESGDHWLSLSADTWRKIAESYRSLSIPGQIEREFLWKSTLSG
ncbi:unnamed protein product [Sympodiomycopsis kandeliae]